MTSSPDSASLGPGFPLASVPLAQQEPPLRSEVDSSLHYASGVPKPFLACTEFPLT